MIASSDYPLSDVQISLEPSAKRMREIDFLCFTSPWNEQDYREMQRQPAYNNWLLEIPNVCTVGMLAFQSVPPEIEILRLGVHPEWRKRGLAELMLEQLEILAKSDRIDSLWLEVDAANKPAFSLYSKLDYKEIGSRKNYFRNPLGKALLLKKSMKYDA